ncbi:MAG: radical SAM protein [Candidatus Njordarchaeota archaeon]
MVEEIKVSSILNKHKKRDDWFLDDYSINPYKLCQFNCVYCYIRGSKYGENMGERIAAKINAVNVLSKSLRLRARKKEYGFIAVSSATEPWQPIEEKYRLTRGCLEVIMRYRFPVHVMTKSKLILRDIDLIKKIDMNAILPADLKNKVKHGALVTFSISVLDKSIAKIFEPGAPSPEERIDTLQKIKEEGLSVGIAFIPVLPFISDSMEQLEEMIKISKDVSADYVFVGALTLFGFGKRIYYSLIEKYFPELLAKYKKLYGVHNYPSKQYQRSLEAKAKKFCAKYGVKYKIIDYI